MTVRERMALFICCDESAKAAGSHGHWPQIVLGLPFQILANKTSDGWMDGWQAFRLSGPVTPAR
ncbi:hypothetical protein Mapa_011328 [Marchantia paleacea]|nr:hypothetical protein Mapa_011328 [Marchantia paleacea]